MKILYVTTISNTVNAFLIPHIRLLIEQGHQVDVAFNIVQEVNPELTALGCNIYNIPFQRSPLKTKNYRSYRIIKELVSRGKYELIHTHTPVASFIARLACRNCVSTRVLYTAHGFHFYKRAPWKSWAVYYMMERFVARWTDGIITINEEDYRLANRFKLRNGANVYKVSGVGVNLTKFTPQIDEKKRKLRKEFGYQDSDIILLSVAELNDNKHQDLLINVINLLKEKIPNIKLLFAGTGILEMRYKEQVEAYGLEKEVIFLGYRKDIPNLLEITDIVVSSSKREGLPVNVMEAMAKAKPLVVTDCRGNRDLVKNNENGFVVGINDVKGFAEAIERLHSSQSLRQAFSKKSIELVGMYSLESVMIEMEEIYSNYLPTGGH